MKMKLSGMEAMELDGHIGRVRVTDSGLQLDIRLDRPLGWSAGAVLTRQDVFRMLWLMLKSPATWGFLLFNRR
jgi:hypothetical protein